MFPKIVHLILTDLFYLTAKIYFDEGHKCEFQVRL